MRSLENHPERSKYLRSLESQPERKPKRINIDAEENFESWRSRKAERIECNRPREMNPAGSQTVECTNRWHSSAGLSSPAATKVEVFKNPNMRREDVVGAKMKVYPLAKPLSSSKQEKRQQASEKPRQPRPEAWEVEEASKRIDKVMKHPLFPYFEKRLEEDDPATGLPKRGRSAERGKERSR